MAVIYNYPFIITGVLLALSAIICALTCYISQPGKHPTRLGVTSIVFSQSVLFCLLTTYTMFWFSQVSNIAGASAHTQRWIASACFFIASLIAAYTIVTLNDKAALLHSPRTPYKAEGGNGTFSPENYFAP
jgi:hypothetical protein